ncbi:MAG TPA: hypothetical protein VHX61_00240 [Rhizomicrobium sp.]|nr:hypothetical protein [Rhizomicrobium sp.]
MTSRLCWPEGAKKPVSFMPSGSKIRSWNITSSGRRAAREHAEHAEHIAACPGTTAAGCRFTVIARFIRAGHFS